MTGAQAVLNAPVSVALLPNRFCWKGSFLAWCTAQSCHRTTQIWGSKGSGPREKYLKELNLLNDTFTPIFETLLESKRQIIFSMIGRDFPKLFISKLSYLNRTCLRTECWQSEALSFKNYIKVTITSSMWPLASGVGKTSRTFSLQKRWS